MDLKVNINLLDEHRAQGRKRRAFAGNDYVASVDPDNGEADFRALEDVPLADYDAALVCVWCELSFLDRCSTGL